MILRGPSSRRGPRRRARMRLHRRPPRVRLQAASRRPQGQRAPFSFTTMCPSSPAAPRPSHSSPVEDDARRRPRSPTRRRAGSTRTASPRRAGTRPGRATLTSLPRKTGGPGRPSGSGRAGTYPPNRRHVPGLGHGARRSVDYARRADADRRRARPVSTPASSADSRTASTIAPAIACRAACSLGVWPPGLAEDARRPSSTTTTWIFVPPRSTPARMGIVPVSRRGPTGRKPASYGGGTYRPSTTSPSGVASSTQVDPLLVSTCPGSHQWDLGCSRGVLAGARPRHRGCKAPCRR